MWSQITAIPMKKTLNCRGRLIDMSTPAVMGILNVTPDSFFDGGTYQSEDLLMHRAEQHLKDGAKFLDVGAISSRPMAEMVSEEQEKTRLIPAVEAIHKRFPEAIISVDTFRANIAHMAIQAGGDIINDISGGELDEAMFETIAQLQVPYILMHMKGTPQTMQHDPKYGDVTEEVFNFLVTRVHRLKELGVHDIILDPGFGFGKSVDHNYDLLDELDHFLAMGLPLLAGFSRKSMINKVIGTTPDTALNGTSVLNTLALQKGASILRDHDVKEAMQAVALINRMRRA
ncbi:MAG: dihydropteroate synthase [Flavobacteriales bacterium]|nr:dihydropteroate synthase [Flavobacteriales bacterium]